MSSSQTTFEPPQLPPLVTDDAQFQTHVGAISRHSTVFLAGALFSAAGGYFFKIYVARALGADALGIYALGMTLLGFLGIANGFGLPQTAARFVAEYSATRQSARLRGLLRKMWLLVLLANAILAAVIMLAGPPLARHLYHAPALTSYLPFFAILLGLAGLTDFCRHILAGYKQIALRTVLTNFIGSPLYFGSGIIAISTGFALRGYLLSQVAAGAVVLFLLLVAVRRVTAPSRGGDPQFTPTIDPKVIHFSMAALGIGFLEFLLSHTDKVVLGIFSNVREVGIYAVAATVVAFVPVALQSVNQIFAPTIADLCSRGETVLLSRLFQTLTKWVTGLTLPLAFVIMIYSKQLMLLFGPAFGAGWAVLVVGTLGQLINTAVGPAGYLLLMSGNQGRLIRVQGLMAIFVVAATLVLVKPFGIIGVAVAAALTNALSNYLYLREVRAALNISPYNRKYFLLIPPALIVLTITLAIKVVAQHQGPQWLWAGVSLLISYGVFCGLALIFGLDADDKLILKAVRDRFRGVAGTGVTAK